MIPAQGFFYVWDTPNYVGNPIYVGDLPRIHRKPSTATYKPFIATHPPEFSQGDARRFEKKLLSRPQFAGRPPVWSVLMLQIFSLDVDSSTTQSSSSADAKDSIFFDLRFHYRMVLFICLIPHQPPAPIPIRFSLSRFQSVLIPFLTAFL